VLFVVVVVVVVVVVDDDDFSELHHVSSVLCTLFCLHGFRATFNDL
jgi:hypothetical protein